MPNNISISEGSTVGVAAELQTGIVKAAISSLRVYVTGFKYDIGGLRGTYPGAVDQAVTDDDTSYVYLDSSAALQINTTGFPTDTHIPLGRVVAANGEVCAIHEERVLLASSSGSVGTCVITLPVDGDVRGGDTSASSNNDWAAVAYEDSGTGEARNRLVRRVPRNYVSGDLVIRAVCPVSAAVSGTKKSRWEIRYKFASLGEALGSLATVAHTEDHTGQGGDELFAIDMTIPEESLDMDKELMALQINRDNDHADDDLAASIYVHNVEIRYTGRMLAGQAGQ